VLRDRPGESTDGRGRTRLGCLLGGAAGGGAAWSFATLLGAAVHASWLATFVGMIAAVVSARALAGVDAEGSASST
jgi:hypothetical protein